MKKIIKENKSFCVFIFIAVVMFLCAVFARNGNNLLFTIFVNYLLLPLSGLICCGAVAKKCIKKGLAAIVIFTLCNVLVAFVAIGCFDIIFPLLQAGATAIGFIAGAVFRLIKKK